MTTMTLRFNHLVRDLPTKTGWFRTGPGPEKFWKSRTSSDQDRENLEIPDQAVRGSLRLVLPVIVCDEISGHICVSLTLKHKILLSC